MLRFPLMRSNFSRSDLDKVIEHLSQDDPILTNGSNCKLFEDEWNQWLGSRYSVFVNSGSSANLLSMMVLKLLNPDGGEIIVPPLTWSSDVASVLHVGFEPVFVDIDAKSLAMDTAGIINSVTKNTKGVFLTHAQGFDGLTDELLEFLAERKIPLIEDVCESHGATHNGRKVGTFGLMSNFSFYYAHHMSTIEGGMVCTDNEEIYEKLRMLRAHGMVREASLDKTQQEYKAKYPDLNEKFIFAYAGYNMRNNEIGGILGREQLKRLDKNNKIRCENLVRFLDGINQEIFQTDFKLEGASNYAFNLVLKKEDNVLMEKLMTELTASGVEFRRGSAGGGNQARQPYLEGLIDDKLKSNLPITDHIHFYGMYIGNFPDLKKHEVDEIVSIINRAVS